MLKLMKYEFRKLRMVLLIMLIALVVLEIGFVAGYHFEKPDVFGVCIALITILTFAVYGYILVSGVAGYYRELSNRTGYMIFMTPRRSIEIVLSKILFTLLAAIAATLVFGAAAYLDYRFLVNGLNVDASVIKQANMALRMAFGNFQLSLDHKGPVTGVFEMRRHLSCYFKGLPDFKDTRIKLVTTTDPQEIFRLLDYVAERWGDTPLVEAASVYGL